MNRRRFSRHHNLAVINIGLAAAMAFSVISCAGDSNQSTAEYVEIRGETMGTTYLVRHEKVYSVDYSDSIASVLDEINSALSTYLPESSISVFNREGVVTFPTDRDGTETDPAGQHFMANLYESQRVWQLTEGAFDPTVSALVNAWGFGWEGKRPVAPDSFMIDSLLQVVGMQRIEVDRVDQIREIRSLTGTTRLDFSAIAKGYAVDIVADFLESNGLYNYFVEIGGEVRVRGLSHRGDPWIVGINTPSPGAAISDIYTRVSPGTGAMATSGNYRNFYNIGGRRVWHTINPQTGYPQENNLLSASIVHARCMRADALATACMVEGYPGCLDMIEELEDTEGFFIYIDENGSVASARTTGFSKLIHDDATETEQ